MHHHDHHSRTGPAAGGAAPAVRADLAPLGVPMRQRLALEIKQITAVGPGGIMAWHGSASTRQLALKKTLKKTAKASFGLPLSAHDSASGGHGLTRSTVNNVITPNHGLEAQRKERLRATGPTTEMSSSELRPSLVGPNRADGTLRLKFDDVNDAQVHMTVDHYLQFGGDRPF